MAIYAFPSIDPSHVSLSLRSNVPIFEAQNSSITSIGRGGERWELDLQFELLEPDDFAVFRAFTNRLNGPQHRFTIGVPGITNRGVLTGTPVVKGAGQTGKTLDIDGATPSTSNWIRAGDIFQVGSELKEQAIDADSDGSGNVTLTFGPRLRASPADNAAIVVSSPVGQFIKSEQLSTVTIRAGGYGGGVIRAIEDVNA